jgi:hypothetical protein
MFEVPLILGTTAALTPAANNAASGTELYATSKVTRNKVDLANYTSVRMVCLVVATGNAAGGSYKLQYATAENATWASSTGLADTGCEVVVGSNGGGAGVLHDSGWVSLPSGAKIANCYLAAVVGTAMGSTAATIGSLSVFFK